MRLWLAFKCFWLILFGKILPDEIAPYAPKQLRAPDAASEYDDARLVRTGEVSIGDLPAGKVKVLDDPALSSTQPLAPHLAQASAATGAIQLLALFQREGRLVDFLREDITSYNDAQIGAAVRDIHKGCRRVLEERMAIAPILDGAEESSIRLDAGFDPARIRVTGNVIGEPPFTGKLKHPGWRTTKAVLPELPRGSDSSVIASAEVEIA
jgi:hypothetical protein